MSRKRARRNLHRWVAISLAAHIILLLLPANIFQAIFPRGHPSSSGSLRDLTPDFAEVAIAILRIPAGPFVEVPEEEFEDLEEIEEIPSGVPSAAPPRESTGEGRGPGDGLEGGQGPSTSEPIFFPARPRLIVPPSLEDLKIKSLRVDLKILVGASGIPEEVILPDSLSDREIGRRLMESVLRFRFEPARKGDLPVASWVDLPLLLESSPRK